MPEFVKCPCCKGKGSIMSHSDTYDLDYPSTCSMCYGKGKVEKEYLRWLRRKKRNKKSGDYVE